ncbi:uncharacterized protein [Choristoneura fumiferana]|uniref:uncharacterized protein n=1 Tax=Choristoneura fumiferana TaxID=7141 RepID=UPI003D15E33B
MNSTFRAPAPANVGPKRFITEAFISPQEDNNSTSNTTVKEADVVTPEPQDTDNKDDKSTTLNLNATTIDCVENNKTLNEEAQNCSETNENITEINEIKDKDSVMQYVFAKNNEVIPQKISGHIRNSLKRRRRSVDLQADNIKSNSAPEIVNYETKHSTRDREIALPLLERNSHIKNSDLADFNIETLHEPMREIIKELNNNKNAENHDRLDKPIIVEENSSESKERDEKIGKRTKPEIDERSNEASERDDDDSKERTNDSYEHRPDNIHETHENEDLKSPPKNYNSQESQESGERSDEKDDKSKYIESRGRNIESGEDENDSNDRESAPRQKYFNNDPKEVEIKTDYHPQKSRDDSSEDNEKPRDNIKQLNFDESDKDVPKSIRDVDLSDFSYERIQVNDKGEVEPAKDTHDNEDNEPLDEQVNKSETNDKNPRSDYIEKKNNGEIKPVVEINTESSNSNEFSDESEETNQPEKADLNSEDKSLETLLGVKESEDDKSGETNEKIIAKNEEPTDGNVKQQFERIPLNYKHDKKPVTGSTDHDQQKENTKSNNEAPAEGTLETLLPKEHRYDENLHLKFDDVNIKLPEIKLPEDILSYAYENPYSSDRKVKNKQNDKERFYHYSDEHSDENPLKHVSQYDDDRGYYNYDAPKRKQNYKKKQKKNSEEDDDDHEDLYEKFVRERFGRRGSFEKRSEALRNEVFRPSNPQLSETIHQILKKSKNIEKDAEKSGDPKAGYMWTLEYGENL